MSTTSYYDKWNTLKTKNLMTFRTRNPTKGTGRAKKASNRDTRMTPTTSRSSNITNSLPTTFRATAAEVGPKVQKIKKQS